MLKTKSYYFLVICAIFCFSQVAVAQSGRRPQKSTPTPQPTPVVTETKTPTSETPLYAKIESMLIVGEIQINATLFSSNYLNIGLKECVEQLNSQPNLKVNVKKGGKMTLKEAQDRAKKEDEVYVLWIGYVLGDNGAGAIKVDHTEYIVLMPKSGKKLTMGRVAPGDSTVVMQGGVLKIPATTKRTSTRDQVKDLSREITYRLRKGGWFED